LRLLETQCYRTVGGIKQRKADFRLICASHRNLLELVEAGQFRKDLYYRIAGFPISLPALNERRDDISALVVHFLKQSELRHKNFSKAALKRIGEYNFPGNIRELKNIVEQAALLANEDIIEVHDLPEQIFIPNSSTNESNDDVVSLEEAEAKYLKRLCDARKFSIDELADKLDVSTRTLYRKLQKYGLKYE
jgi:DNA-binding NtrC family response regulator